MMKFLSRIAFLAVLAGTGAHAAEDQSHADSVAIRAGHNIAVTSCVACHTVSPNQALPPVLGPGIPTFEDIANRPDISADSLRAAMKTARWHDKALASRLLPMSRLSDKQQGEVAAFIVSLRKTP